jgi:sensor histidine kinase YesM
LNNKIPDPRGYSEIGLSNVNERLSLFFGQESKLQISSIPLSGTQIEFDIPFSE